MMGGMGFGLLGFGMLLMILFWVLVIGGVVALVVGFTRAGQGQTGPRPAAPNQTPLDILQARYAKGEITKEQFEEMRRDLGV